MQGEAEGQLVEHIGDEQTVSRAFLRNPDVPVAPESDFPFTYDRVRDERAVSVFWRKYAPADADVHARGCALQAWFRPQFLEYIGFRSAGVASIRSITTERGYKLDVVHFEQTGDKAHAHIAIRPPGDTKVKKSPPANDRLEIVALLIKTLSNIQPHTCPEG